MALLIVPSPQEMLDRKLGCGCGWMKLVTRESAAQ